jgi:hypothetical protein
LPNRAPRGYNPRMESKYYLIAAGLFILAGIITCFARNFAIGAMWIAVGAAFVAISQRKTP